MSGEQVLRMRAADAAWLRMGGPANPMVINALVRFDDPLEQGALARLLLLRLVGPYPKFAMNVREGGLPLIGALPAVGVLPSIGPLRRLGPHWERDPYFAIDRHLHHVALPGPGDEDELRALVGDLVSSPLPEDRPPWQAHLIECGGADNALLMRMHHCIADGIALAQVLLSLTDEPDVASAVANGGAAAEHGAGAERVAGAEHAADRERGEAGVEPGRQSGGGIAGALVGAAQLGVEALVHPHRLLELARGGARDVEVLARLLAHPADPTGSLKAPLSGVRRVGWSQSIELDAVAAIAHGNGATVNDVLLAAVAGALRAERPAHAGGRATGVGERARPERMTAIVPFNLRPAQAPVPRELGNDFGLVFLDMPVSVSSRRARLAEVKRQMDAIKRSPEGRVTYTVLRAIGLAPAELESRLVDFFSSKGSAVITNVPGPRAQRTFAGARVRDLDIWAPASGSVGMTMSLFSYRGHVTVGLLSDVGVLSDPQAVAARVALEIEALGRLKPARRAA